MSVSREEAKELLKYIEICDECNGHKKVEYGYHAETCRNCGGSGLTISNRRSG